MGKFASVLVAGLVGVVVGGSGVYFTLSGSDEEEAARAAGRARAAARFQRDGEAKPIVVQAEPTQPLPERPVPEPAPERDQRDEGGFSDPAVPGVLERSDWDQRLADRSRSRSPVGPGEIVRDRDGRLITPEAKAFLNDRTLLVGESFLDAAEATLQYFGTPDEEQARKDLGMQLRNTMYYTPENAKEPVRRLYEATKSYVPGDPDKEFEWQEARRDLVAELDRIE